MTRNEFEIKWISDSLMSMEVDEEYKADLNSVIKDELNKLKDWLNSNEDVYSFIMNDDLETYLNQSK